MIFNKEESLIYVELDALIDTRLPSIGLLSSQAAVECSRDLRYFDRVIDDFEEICGVTREAYRNAYSRRTADVVRAGVITEIPFILDGIIKSMEQDANDTPFISRTRVQVNYYPYEFEPETLEVIATAVMARCGSETLVEMVRVDPKALTPTMIKDRYSGMVLYNFRDWLKHHLVEFEKVKMPRVTVVAPALYHDVVPSEDAFVADGLSPHITAFQLSEVATVEMFALNLLPAANFSMARIPGQFTPKPEPVVPREEVPVAAPRWDQIK